MWRTLRIVVLVCLGCGTPKESGSSGSADGPRVVCLTPSATEAVAAIAGVEVIVGVDRFSVYPPEVRDLPKVGGFVDPNLEAIIRLRPTLVVIDDVQRALVDPLQAARIPTVVIEMKTVAGLRAGLLQIGRALGRERAAADVVAKLDAGIAATRARAAELAGDRPPRILIVVDRELGGLSTLYAAGPDNYLDELIHLAGGTNALADAPVQFVKISVEQVIHAAPDVILDAVHTTDTHRARDDWLELRGVPAVDDRRIYIIEDTQLNHPSPRLPAQLDHLVNLVYSGE